MKYIIETKHNIGDTIFYNMEGKIQKVVVSDTHCMLKEDGQYVLYYAVNTSKLKYKKQVKDVVLEADAFKTPEEVAAKILEDFKKHSETKEEN